jgi:hypothetical protein
MNMMKKKMMMMMTCRRTVTKMLVHVVGSKGKGKGHPRTGHEGPEGE